MSHSRMLTTRRRKKKAGKQRSRVAKLAKKLGKQGVKVVGTDIPREPR